MSDYVVVPGYTPARGYIDSEPDGSFQSMALIRGNKGGYHTLSGLIDDAMGKLKQVGTVITDSIGAGIQKQYADDQTAKAAKRRRYALIGVGVAGILAYFWWKKR